MSVYIKGMEMPKVSGRMEAVITILKDGTAQIAISPADDQIGYWKEYPLVPIPPHGRLIDADVLFQDLLFPSKQFEQGMRELVADAPTIIPAEEGEA